MMDNTYEFLERIASAIVFAGMLSIIIYMLYELNELENTILGII